MIDYERIATTWGTLCNIAEEGDGPWRAMYESRWIAKHKDNARLPIPTDTRSQAVAVAAALNLCLFIDSRTIPKQVEVRSVRRRA